MVSNPRFHRGSYAQSLVNAAKVIKHEVELACLQETARGVKIQTDPLPPVRLTSEVRPFSFVEATGLVTSARTIKESEVPPCGRSSHPARRGLLMPRQTHGSRAVLSGAVAGRWWPWLHFGGTWPERTRN